MRLICKAGDAGNTEAGIVKTTSVSIAPQAEYRGNSYATRCLQPDPVHVNVIDGKM